MNRRGFLKAGFLAAAAAGLPGRAPAAEAQRAPAAGRPNIIFIMTDQQFADAMSCRMGKTWINTPAMDGLADGGTLFSRAYSANPLCMPLRNSLFTGRYPHETGVTRNAGVKLDTNEFVCMGTYFKQAGYATGYFGKWHLCFDSKDPASHGFDSINTGAKDADTADRAVQFLSEKRDKPFLLVVSFLNPHNICEYSRGQDLSNGPIGDAPPPDKCPPAPANLEPPENETDTMTTMRKGYHAARTFPVGDFTPDQWRRLRWGYYRLIEKVDAELGKVMAGLRKAGLADETVVIFTADHGDCAGAHRFNQKTVFYDESARVPLIIWGKGRAKKAVCDKLVNTGVDILPTMMDFAGIAAPKKLRGRSLRPPAAGEQPADWRRCVVVENDMAQAGTLDDGFHPASQGRMVRSERYKYCIYEYGIRRESIVDMEKDPLEMRNLAGDPACRPVLEEHRRLLEQFAAETADATASAMLAGGVPPRPFPTGDRKNAAEPATRRKQKTRPADPKNG